MKTKKGLIYSLIPLVITLSMFVVFNSRISCQPDSAGFWFVLALGMAIGVVITRFSLRSQADKKDNKQV